MAKTEKAPPEPKRAALKKEVLECECRTDKNHVTEVDNNGETIVKCTKCERFIKFPAKNK